ncbi:MAG: ABC transporter ATP-binding protein/permease [Halanaerobiales bacterium]|nr:ABC transporter ATP-binding protein/permease [Halanaerobiales bacterium]
MNYQKSKVIDKVKAAVWAIQLAWKIDKRILVFWFGISIFLSIIPALILLSNRHIISHITSYISTGQGDILDIVPSFILLGGLLILFGLSKRLNSDFLYMVMYDSYYLGFQELIIDKMQKIDLQILFDKDTRDEYIAVISRAGSLTDFISAMCTLAAKCASMVSLLVVAFNYSTVIFIISILFILVSLIVNAKFVEKVRLNMARIRENERMLKYYGSLPLDLGIAKEIRIFDTKNDIIDQWTRAYHKVCEQQKGRFLGENIRALVSGVGYYLFSLIVILHAVNQVAYYGMTTDIFLLLFMLCQNVSTALANMISSIGAMDYGLFSLERQLRFLQSVAEIPAGPPLLPSSVATTRIFEMQDVSFAYKPGVLVLKDINLQIHQGEIIALVGHNGSGKSTLIKLLIGQYRPGKGTIRFLGHPYEEYGYDYLKNQIGVFFQKHYQFHASIHHNVGFGDISRIDDLASIEDALIKGGAKSIVDRLPYGMESWLGRDVDENGVVLSGGEKQRIAVARTHMSCKDVIIFDEPASALDPIAEMEQFYNIKNKIKGKTAILISHRIGFARLADRIIVLDKGRIVENGRHEELIDQNGLYSYLFKQQAKWYKK